MKMNCNIMRDLLPLYADASCSEESKKAVEEHVLECAECAAILKRMMRPEIEGREELQRENFTAQKAFRKVRRKLRAKWLKTAICLILCATIFLLTINQFSTQKSRFALNFSYTGLWNRLCVQQIMRFLKEDPYGLEYPFLDTDMIYEDHQKIYHKMILQNENSGKFMVSIGEESCYISQSVYENEYQAYLQSGSEADFWAEMIMLNQPIIPEEAMEEIMASNKYQHMIYEKFHYERDYGEYSENYLEHIYTKRAPIEYGYQEGYYYRTDYQYEALVSYQEELADAALFIWQPEENDEIWKQELKSTITKISMDAINLGEAGFDRKCREQFLEIVTVFQENNAVIQDYTIEMTDINEACVSITLRDGAGDPQYAALETEENKYKLYIELEKGKIMRIYGMFHEGVLMQKFVEERGLQLENEKHIYLANPYRYTYLIDNRVH